MEKIKVISENKITILPDNPIGRDIDKTELLGQREALIERINAMQTKVDEIDQDLAKFDLPEVKEAIASLEPIKE